MQKARGFTLIELMIAIVIVAILASIAIPSYREYVIRGNRRAAQAAMMEIATRQQQFFVANRRYATKEEIGYSLPPEIDDKYIIDIDVETGPPPGFDIIFEATGSQDGDGDLTLDSQGNKTGKW